MVLGLDSVNPFKDTVEREYSDGEAIVFEGDVDSEMFIIQHGRVRVSKDVDGREIELAELSRGDFFGEMALLESLPRSATVRAVGDTQVQVIQPGGLMMKFRRDPTFAFEMLQRLSSRIRNINKLLIESLGNDDIDKESAENRAERSEYEIVEEKADSVQGEAS
jgi:CRP/FNR family transcriptional regulator